MSCTANALTGITASAPCSVPPFARSTDTSYTQLLVAVQTDRPGVCHVALTFAGGFTYSTDVTFTTQTGGCDGCPSFIAPTSGPIMVTPPANICAPMAGDGGGVAAGGDANDAEIVTADAASDN